MMQPAPVSAFPCCARTLPSACRKSLRGAPGVGTPQRQQKFGFWLDLDRRSNPLQGLWAGAIPHACGQLPPVRAYVAAEGGISNSAAGSAGSPGRRPPAVRKVAEPGNCRKHRAAHPAVARIACYDAEPTAGAFARLAVLSFADRERADDAEPWQHSEERFPRRWASASIASSCPNRPAKPCSRIPFIQGLRPFLRQLDWEQWQSILKRLQAISDHVSTSGQMRTMPPIASRPAPAAVRVPLHSAVVGRR